MKKLIAFLLTVAVSVCLFTPLALCEEFSVYDMGIPDLHGRRYMKGDMNMDVYWVQVQMKATGRWYQGDQWDCTGNLGDHTMHEIASFMKSCGYSGHSGCVDQNVVNELANWLGYNVQPVYIGGFYDAMGAIMTNADNKRECGEWGCCVKSLKNY